MPPTLSKPHVDGCNDYKMRIDFILNPVKNPGPDNFYFEQPCMCTKDMKVDIVANIEKVCSSSAMINGV
jgi:hypothetical protein